MTLKTFSIEDIRSWKPCYDPARHLPENWSGTALDILEAENEMPIPDRLWVVLREELLPPRLLRLFAVWCARQVQHLMTDERSIIALDVSEKFANGLATRQDLDSARDAAGAAARDAARAARDAGAGRDAGAAGDAAWAAGAAAGAAAWDAARAAGVAAGDAARAAGDAAGDAAWAAAGAAWAAAWDAAGDAARAAARAAQLEMLIKMIKGEKRESNEPTK